MASLRYYKGKVGLCRKEGVGHRTMTEGKPNGNKGADELRWKVARGYAQRDVGAMS